MRPAQFSFEGRQKWITNDGNDTAGIASELLAKGKNHRLLPGRLEWGPRALGNRSILANPREPKIKDLVNYYVMNALRTFQHRYELLGPGRPPNQKGAYIITKVQFAFFDVSRYSTAML